MLRTGRRWMGVAAAVSALVAGYPALAADAAGTTSLAAAAAVANSAAAQSQTLQGTVTQNAMDLMRSGRAADALALLEPVAARFAAQARGPGAHAYCAHDAASGGPKGARVVDAQTCDALYLRAFAFTELGRRADAVEALEQLTALSPDYPRYLVELAYAYRAGGDKAKAMATYSHAAELAARPQTREANRRYHAAALRGIGYLLVDQGDLAGAEKAYRASLIDDPDNKIATSELAMIARRLADASRGGMEQKGG